MEAKNGVCAIFNYQSHRGVVAARGLEPLTLRI